MSKIDLSIIVPCYNEGPTFTKSACKIIRELKKINLGWEIIFVEDKSQDNTKSAVENLIKKIENSRAIYHRQNEGRGKSVSDGITSAKGKICGYLDVDLEVSQTYIPIFLEEINKGYAMAVGKRFYEGGLKSLPRFLASKVYALIVKTTLKVPIEDTEAGYKFFNREKILPILKKTKDNHWFWDTEICAIAYYANLKISQVPVLFKRRLEKKSTVRLIPDTVDYIKKIVKFRTQLPQIAKANAK